MQDQQTKVSVSQVVVNWHLTEACNYSCKYCYATWARPDVKREIWKDNHKTKQLLKALRSYFHPENSDCLLHRDLSWDGLRLSLAGGEPMVVGNRFREIVEEAVSLGFEISVITNGSYLSENMMRWLAPKLSMLGISVDDTDAGRNSLIGRLDAKGRMHSEHGMLQIVESARAFNPDLVIKLNTVVNRHNWDSDLGSLLSVTQPDRWKVLRALPVATDELSVTDEQFQSFVERHELASHYMDVEDNEAMHRSYIMVDPFGRFYQNGQQGGYAYSDPIPDIGVSHAFKQIPFSAEGFAGRYTRLLGKTA